jgi:hypothetical protein
MKKLTCSDCRDGEHDNYDEDIHLVIVREPDNGKMLKRAYLCGEHISMYLDDGYKVD